MYNFYTKICSFLLTGVLLLGMAACTDVTVDPKSETAGDVIFDDPDSYRAFVAKLYAGLSVTGQQGPAGDGDIGGIDEGFSSYVRQLWTHQEITTDAAITAWQDEGLFPLQFHTWSPANQFVTAMHDRIFFQVSMANEFLRQTSDEELDARGVDAQLRADIEDYRAEARFLRALSYWHAVDMYGNTVLVTEEDPIGRDAPEQSTREEIFAYAESELLAIENELAPPGEADYGRADRGAAWMLLAKLYQNAEVYIGEDRSADALEYTERIINSGAYELHDDFVSLFSAENNFSSEIIFPVPFDGERTRTFGGMTFLINAAIGGSMDPQNYGSNEGWWGNRVTSPVVGLFDAENHPEGDARNLFYTEDQRREIETPSDFHDGYAFPKFTNVGGQRTDYPDTDFPMFRLGDAYLMYAEAVLRGGGGSISQAVTYINELRERAYGDASGNITEDELTLDFIIDERARELMWEGHRRTDLVRFDRFTQNYTWPWKGNVQEGTESSQHRDLFPIPASEMRASPDRQQNPGY